MVAAPLPWVRCLGIGTVVLLLGVVLVAARFGPGGERRAGAVGTLALAGGAEAVHDRCDTDG